MIEEYKKRKNPMIGAQEVPLKDVVCYGMIKFKKGSREVEGIIEKPSVKETPSRLACFGRMILNQEIVDALEKTGQGKDNELWTVDAITKYIKGGGKFYAKEVEGGEWLTTGDPLNYVKTILKYAVERDDIGKEVVGFLQKLV